MHADPSKECKSSLKGLTWPGLGAAFRGGSLWSFPWGLQAVREGSRLVPSSCRRGSRSNPLLSVPVTAAHKKLLEPKSCPGRTRKKEFSFLHLATEQQHKVSTCQAGTELAPEQLLQAGACQRMALGALDAAAPSQCPALPCMLQAVEVHPSQVSCTMESCTAMVAQPAAGRPAATSILCFSLNWSPQTATSCRFLLPGASS